MSARLLLRALGEAGLTCRLLVLRPHGVTSPGPHDRCARVPFAASARSVRRTAMPPRVHPRSPSSQPLPAAVFRPALPLVPRGIPGRKTAVPYLQTIKPSIQNQDPYTQPDPLRPKAATLTLRRRWCPFGTSTLASPVRQALLVLRPHHAFLPRPHVLHEAGACVAAPALRAIALRAFRIPRPPLAFRLVGPVRLRLTSAACAGRPPPQRRPDARNRRRLRRPASVRKGISSPRTPHLCQDGKPPFLRFSTPRYAEPLPLPRPSSDKPRHSPSDDGGSTASFHLRWPPLRAKHGCSHRAFGYVFTAAPRTPLCGRLTVPPSSLSALRALRSERAAVCPASKVSPPLGTPLCQKREPAVLYFPFDKLTEPSALNRASHWFMGFSLPVCIVPHAIQLRCDQAHRSDGSTIWNDGDDLPRPVGGDASVTECASRPTFRKRRRRPGLTRTLRRAPAAASSLCGSEAATFVSRAGHTAPQRCPPATMRPDLWPLSAWLSPAVFFTIDRRR